MPSECHLYFSPHERNRAILYCKAEGSRGEISSTTMDQGLTKTHASPNSASVQGEVVRSLREGVRRFTCQDIRAITLHTGPNRDAFREAIRSLTAEPNAVVQT